MSVQHPRSPRSGRMRRYVVSIQVALLAAEVLFVSSPLKGQQFRIVDRIVAVVDQFIITRSDLETALRMAALGDQGPKGPTASGTKTVLDQLIEQRLIRREIENFPGLEVSSEEVSRELERLDERHRSEGGLDVMADHWNLTREDIEAEIVYQLRVRNFMTIRFLSFATVEDLEIDRFYREELPGQLAQAGIDETPPLPTVENKIREILAERKVASELKRWLDDLKAKADITIFPEGLRFVSSALDRSHSLDHPLPGNTKILSGDSRP